MRGIIVLINLSYLFSQHNTACKYHLALNLQPKMHFYEKFPIDFGNKIEQNQKILAECSNL